MIPLHAGGRGSRIGPIAAIVLLAAALIAGCGDAGSAASPSNASAAPSVAAISTPSPDATALASASPSARPSRAAASIGPTPVPSDGRDSGEARTDAWGIEQVWVPAGTFRMGTSAAAIAALLKTSPPDWVATELPSEQPAHEVTLSHGYWIDRTEVTNKAFDAFVAAGGYATRALWSEAGWAWLAGQDVDAPAATVRRRRPRGTPPVHHLVRGRSLRDVACRPSAHGGAMGVRGARPRVGGLPVGRPLRREPGQRGRQHRAQAGRELSRRHQLGQRARHGRQRDGVGRRLARSRTTTRRVRPRTRPGPRRARSRSRRAAGGAAMRSSPARPIATTRIRRPTATSTSASGSSRTDRLRRDAALSSSPARATAGGTRPTARRPGSRRGPRCTA